MDIHTLFCDLPQGIHVAIVPYQRHDTRPIPLVASTISAGFPSPAEDYLDTALDLNDLVVKHPAATFFVRGKGHSMIDAGISTGDVLVVDRALDPSETSIVVAVLNGDFTVKRINRCNGRFYLIPANRNLDPIPVTEETDFQIWGVVTHVIHKL